MYKTIVISVILFRFGFCVSDVCPKYIICETSEGPGSCPEGKFYRANAKVHNCCPGCVASKDAGGACTVDADCQPGLKCESSVCTKDTTQACEIYKRTNKTYIKTKYWNPICLLDGTFAPKQCKGEKTTGKCFCVDKLGKRIHGEEDWNKAQNMTCACSRLVDDLQQKGVKVSLHCDNRGNFEPLQCEGKVCWCANPRTGIPYTVVVPAHMMTSLPCYDPKEVGGQYYRQCDSENHMQEVAVSLLRNHGTLVTVLKSPKCNFDGSFHRVQTLRDKERCVYINNSPLTEYFGSSNANCNCAFNKHAAELTQTEFLPECLPNGNYRNRQIWDKKIYCLDDDGFYYSSNPLDCPK